MIHTLVIPKLSQTMEEATIQELYFADHDFVQAGQAVANISADKADADVAAEQDGYVRYLFGIDEEVPVGKPFAQIADSLAELE